MNNEQSNELYVECNEQTKQIQSHRCREQTDGCYMKEGLGAG